MSLYDKDPAKRANWVKDATRTICDQRERVEEMSSRTFYLYVENVIQSAIVLGYELSKRNIACPSPGKTATPSDQISKSE